jgi:hypothetical protein
MLGWELDIASLTGEQDHDFDDLPNVKNPLYDRSYRSFISTIHGLQGKISGVELPKRQMAFHYAVEYLHTVGGFIPILHKPSFLDLVK